MRNRRCKYTEKSPFHITIEAIVWSLFLKKNRLVSWVATKTSIRTKSWSKLYGRHTCNAAHQFLDVSTFASKFARFLSPLYSRKQTRVDRTISHVDTLDGPVNQRTAASRSLKKRSVFFFSKHPLLWWHISAITWQIIMSTCQIFTLTMYI